MEDENAEYDGLERKYRGKCELCNKMNADAWCKIGKDGKHIHLTFSRRRAWAAALTQQKHGVTYDVPPNTDSFTPFHIKATAPAPAPVPDAKQIVAEAKNTGFYFVAQAPSNEICTRYHSKSTLGNEDDVAAAPARQFWT
ncbi:hypothetical protein B0H14DRAFT_2605167 [Mycena olivaceomarginata]|nr:hypothetical protein B0H14DRAFT_2605167 [Mycena olivaceomarginata]